MVNKKTNFWEEIANSLIDNGTTAVVGGIATIAAGLFLSWAADRYLI